MTVATVFVVALLVLAAVLATAVVWLLLDRATRDRTIRDLRRQVETLAWHARVIDGRATRTIATDRGCPRCGHPTGKMHICDPSSLGVTGHVGGGGNPA